MIDQRLAEIIRDVLGDDDLVLDETTTATDVDGWDSLAHINIMVAIEADYGVTFDTDQLGRFRDVGELQAFLRSRAT
jgi:acyl carrier protein